MSLPVPVRSRRLIIGLLAAAGILPAAAACTGSPPAPGTPVTRAEVASVLARHASALRTGQRAEFLSGVGTGPAASAFRREQSTEFANLSRLPLARWSYRVDSRAQDATAQRAAQQRFGSSAVVYRVTVSVALAGVDPQASPHDLWWTFTRQDGDVVAVDDTALAQVGGVSWRGPWDTARLTAVRTRSALVLGPPRDGTELHVIASTVDSAVPVVDSVWGRDWTGRVLVLVPSGIGQLSVDLGTGSGPGQVDGDAQVRVAAEARTDGIDPVSGDVLDPRLVVVPRQFARLTAVGRSIVVRHEITHLATAAATTDASPRWLVEGFAEYVANLHTGQSVPYAASELARAVRAGGLPAHLPGESDFDHRSTAARAYEEAWLACRLVADRIGVGGLVRFYRAVGASPDLPGAAVAHALSRLLHETSARFTAVWRRYLVRELDAGSGG